MIKLIVTDVDGTIVGKDEILHQEFIDYVQRLKARGIDYTIATGRVRGLAAHYVEALGISIPYAAGNGGCIVRGEEVILEKTIPLSAVREVIEKADQMGMSVMYSIDGQEQAYRETDYVLQQQRDYDRYHEPKGFSEEEWESLHVDKIIVMAKYRDGSIGEIEVLCSLLPPEIGYKRYADKSIDIFHREAKKEIGVKLLASLMQVSLEEVLFVGDDLNDVKALREAGIGAAVANAQQPAKDAADYVTEGERHLGVMEAIDRFVLHDNSLRRQSYSLPLLLKELLEDIRSQAALLAKTYLHSRPGKVIFMGCGDSHAAAMTMRFSWQRLTGIPAEIVTVMDFSREYLKENLGPDALVVIVSISGNGVRIEEAADKANRCRARTLAITGNPDSGIGRRCSQVLKLNIPPFERGPGNRNYFASILALLSFAIEMGKMTGRLDEAMVSHAYEEMEKQGEQIRQLLPQMDSQLYRISKRWADYLDFDFVGAGDDFVHGWFGHAKAIEAVGAFATFNNSEEWFHMNNFYWDIKHTGTCFFISRNSPGFSRTYEAVEYAVRLGRPVLVVTDEEKARFPQKCEVILVPSSDFPPALFLSHYIPSCILAGYIGAMRGEKNCRGCLGPWAFAAGGKYINESRRIVDE